MLILLLIDCDAKAELLLQRNNVLLKFMAYESLIVSSGYDTCSLGYVGMASYRISKLDA